MSPQFSLGGWSCPLLRLGRLWEGQAWRERGLDLGNAEFDACWTSVWRAGCWMFMAAVQRSGPSWRQEFGGLICHLGGESQWGRGLEPGSEVWEVEEFGAK